MFSAALIDPVAVAQDAPPSTIIWIGGQGDWSESEYWLSSQAFDSSIYTVLIDGGNPLRSVVTLDVDACINDLTIDPDDMLIVLGGHSLMFNSASDLAQFNCAGILQLDGDKETSASLIINFAGELLLQGGGHLQLSNPASSQILSVPTNALLHNIDCTIEGTGLIGAGDLNLSNGGLIDANVPFQELKMQSANAGVMNSGIMQASNAGSLRIVNATVTNLAGQIRALENSRVYLDGVTIMGGTLSTTGNGVIQSNFTPSSWHDVTNAGNFELGPTSLTITGQIVNDGQMHLVAGDTLVPPPLFSEIIVPPGSGDVSVTGSGTMDLRLSKIHSGSAAIGGRLINGPNHTITGMGLIGANTIGLTNLGVIEAAYDLPLVIDPRYDDVVVNEGTLRALSQAGLILSGGQFRNNGVVEVLGGSRCMYTANATELNAVDGILMGTWRVIGDRSIAQLLIPGPGIFFNEGDVTLSGAGSIFGLIDSMIDNSGRFAIIHGRQFTSNTIGFSNFGVLEIGSDSRFSAAAAFVQDPNAELKIEVNATNFQSGAAGLAVTGLATLHGTLHITVAPEYVPVVGQTLHIIKAGALSGAFDRIEAPAGFTISSNATEVIVTVTSTCLGDIDGSGVVNFGDLNAVLSHWGACPAPPASCSADLDDDGVVNAADLLLLISAWGPCAY